MKVALKDGNLHVAMSRPEAERIRKSLEVCDTVMALHPIDAGVTEAATKAGAGLRDLLTLCADEPKTETITEEQV